MMQDILAVTTVLALASTMTFMAAYGWRARGGWWRDPLGRMLMLGGFAVVAITAVGTVRRIDRRYLVETDLSHPLTVASSIAYLIIALVWAYKTRTVLRETRDIHEGRHK